MAVDQRRKEKQTEAAVRKELRDKLTPQQQLKELDIREGKGIGAKKERARLQSKIDGVVPHQEEVKQAEVEVKAAKTEKFKKGKSGK